MDFWLSRGWRRLSATEPHPLSTLVGQRAGTLTLEVLLGPRNRVGAEYFHLFLSQLSGEMSLSPPIIGLFHQGSYPGYNWVEVVSFSALVSFPSGDIPLVDTELELGLLRALCRVIPPGGHLMVEYDSAQRQETALALTRGVPPLVTPLGVLLYRCGCGMGFKDWAIAEGGWEGPRKLQGFKAVNPAAGQQKIKQLAQELKGFLAQVPTSARPEVAAARQRAQQFLAETETAETNTL